MKLPPFRRALMVCGASFALASAASAADPVTLIVPQLDSPKTLSPNFAIDSGAYPAASNIYSTLFTMDWGVLRGTSAYGDLAEKWDVSADGKVYTFHMRKNVKWHDGEPVTSADVKFTYDTIIAKKYPYSTFLRNVESIETPDPDTVILRMKTVDVSVIPMMAQAAQWWGKIYPKHLWEKVDGFDKGDNVLKPIGSGPFKFVRMEPGSVELAANPDYFRGKPAVDRVIIKHVTDANVARAEFDAGQYPWLPFDYAPPLSEVPALQKDPSVQVVFTPSHYGRDLLINMRKAPFDKLEVRQAISYALDRDAINRLAFGGLWRPTYNASVETQEKWVNPAAVFPHFDKAMAEKLLDEAGYKRGADGWRFATTVTGQPLADCKAMMPIIVQQLRQVGINASIVLYDQASFFNILPQGKFDLSCYSTRYGPDPDAYREHFATGRPRDYTGYSNAEVDELAERAITLIDPAQRQPLYQRIQANIVRDVPYVNLFNEQKTTLKRPGWTGFPTDEDGFNKSITWYGYSAVKPPAK
ncbi:ABC transporter substrate-binding protein [Microvirga antarctica]|uniref:ABC transporter substrate-binding protein n=1 Tax=Microvirga antarctica TaxID=2819233 RepID=UPI001B3186D9|nr:ABC transporter substrate-binding protein [Microvirga antarctica]